MRLSVQSIYEWYRQQIRNPKYRWWIVLGTLAYLVSPIDVIPDIIPIAGQLDDVILVSLLVTELSQWVIERVKLQRGDRSAQMPDNNVASSSQHATQSADAVEVDAVSLD
jgi:uncharacterized membrane protein YkvA (DUF1232 family)